MEKPGLYRLAHNVIQLPVNRSLRLVDEPEPYAVADAARSVPDLDAPKELTHALEQHSARLRELEARSAQLLEMARNLELPSTE